MALPNVNIHIYGDIHFHNGETKEKESHGHLRDTCKNIVGVLNNLFTGTTMSQPLPQPTSNESINDTIINAVKHCEDSGIQAKNKNIYKYCLEKNPQFVACVNNWESDIRVRCQWSTIDKRWVEGNGIMSETAFNYLYKKDIKEIKFWRVKKGVYKTITQKEKQKLNISSSFDSNYNYIVITYDNIKVEFKKNRTYITKTILQ